MVKEKINNKNMTKKEILFRGLYEGEWVYGTYHYSADNKHHYILAREKLLVHDGGYMALHDKEVWQVVPESIGQYTGVKDVNGRKIFEGDNIKGTKKEITCTVAYNDHNGGFYAKQDEIFGYTLMVAEGEFGGGKLICPFEVIGNIHETQKYL